MMKNVAPDSSQAPLCSCLFIKAELCGEVAKNCWRAYWAPVLASPSAELTQLVLIFFLLLLLVLVRVATGSVFCFFYVMRFFALSSVLFSFCPAAYTIRTCLSKMSSTLYCSHWTFNLACLGPMFSLFIYPGSLLLHVLTMFSFFLCLFFCVYPISLFPTPPPLGQKAHLRDSHTRLEP